MGLGEQSGAGTRLSVDDPLHPGARLPPDGNHVSPAAHRHSGIDARDGGGEPLDQALEQLDQTVARGPEIAAGPFEIVGGVVSHATVNLDRRCQTARQRRRRRINGQSVDTRAVLLQPAEIGCHRPNSLRCLSQLGELSALQHTPGYPKSLQDRPHIGHDLGGEAVASVYQVGQLGHGGKLFPDFIHGGRR